MWLCRFYISDHTYGVQLVVVSTSARSLPSDLRKSVDKHLINGASLDSILEKQTYMCNQERIMYYSKIFDVLQFP